MKIITFLALQLCALSLFGQLAERPKGTTASALGYLEYLPPAYTTSPSREHPLLLVFGGIGENGDGITQLSRLTQTGVMALIENNSWPQSRDFIVLEPQTSGGGCIPAGNIQDFLHYALETYRVDPTRVYMTGFSCGAIGIWQYLSLEREQLVAAVVPISGDGVGPVAARGCDIFPAIWAFHGEADPQIPSWKTVNPMETLAQCDPPRAKETKLTVYPGVGTRAWDMTYNLSAGNDIYAWLLEHPLSLPDECGNKNASFTTAPVCTGNTLSFVDQSSGLSATASYQWTFGDGGSSTEKNAQHTYTSPGQYDVSLSVKDGVCSLFYASGVVAGEALSVANLTTTPSSALNAADGSIAFSIAGGAPPYAYTLSGNSQTRLFSNVGTANTIVGLVAGNYALQITDANGCTVSATAGVSSNAYCFGLKVVSVKQGKTKNGETIAALRSDVSKVLGRPQENDTYNFFALGFGGNIVLALGQALYDDGTAEPEIVLVETSFGRANEMCFSNGITYYPEQVYVEVSPDGKLWYSLPDSYCRTSFLDIKPAIKAGATFVKFIRITDASDKSQFENSADGFDIDGLIICPADVTRAQRDLTNSRSETDRLAFNPEFINRAPNEEQPAELTLYPNPIQQGVLHIKFTSENATALTLDVLDSRGIKAKTFHDQLPANESERTFNVNDLTPGFYILKAQYGRTSKTTKVIIE